MNYKYVNTEDNYKAMCDFLETTSYFVIDIETGPMPEFIKQYEENNKIGLDPHRSMPYTIQVGTQREQYIFDVRSPFSPQPIMEKLSDPKILKIGQNIRFDLKFLQKHYGVIAKNISDSQIVEQVIRNGIFPKIGGKGDDSGYTRKMTSMASLAKRYLDIEIDKDKDLRMNLWRTPYNKYDERQLAYMASDCIYPDQIIRIQKKMVDERGLRATIELEHKLIPMVANMELVGIPFDRKRWLALYQETVQEKEELQMKLDKIFGVDISVQEDLFGESKRVRVVNYDSTQQMAKLLDAIGIPGFMTSDGQALSTSTDKIVLGKLRGIIPDEIADTISDFRKAKQRESSYGTNFLASLNPVTKRIHPDYTQCVLVTGRMSASPGVQTIPRDPRYRGSFRAPKGYTFIILDASQIEARLSADLTGDLPAIECFQAGQDIYTVDGERLYNRKIDRSTKEGEELRRRAKNAWLGLSYGQWKTKFYTWSMVALNQFLEREETDFLYDRFFEIHGTMKEVMDGWSNLADFEKSNRYIYDDIAASFINSERLYESAYEYYFKSTRDEDKAKKMATFRSKNTDRVYYSESIIGRKRFFPMNVFNTHTAARNAPVQASAADIQKATMLAFQDLHWNEGYDANVILCVHDEIITLVKEEQAEELFKKQKELGEEVGSKFLQHVPVKLEGGVSNYWKKY